MQIKFKIDGKWMEGIVITIFSILFIYVGISNMLGHKLVHDSPYNILASDAAGEISFVEGIKLRGDFKYLYESQCGGFTNCIGFIPSISQQLQAIFSFTSGLEPYDVNQFFAGMFLYIACIIIYLAIRRTNKQVAILSLPLMLFLFQPQFNIGIMWGYFDVIETTVFIAGLIFLISLTDTSEKKVEDYWVVIAILLAAMFLIHVSEMAYALIILYVFIGIKAFISKKIEWDIILFSLKTGILTIVLSSYYLVIFLVTYSDTKIVGGPLSLQWYDPVFSHFLWIQYVIIIGIALSLIFFNQTSKIVTIAGATMLFLGLNIFNLSFVRTTQIRYTWPLYLAVFFGFAIFMLLQVLHLNKRTISVFVAIILMMIFIYNYYKPLGNEGLIDKPHWDSINWIKQNTDSETKILFMYGDIYNQEGIIWNTMRITYKIQDNDFIEKIKNGSVTKYFNSYMSGPTETNLVYWKSFLKVGYYILEYSDNYAIKPRNICQFDYVIFDRASRQPILAQYNMIIAKNMIEGSYFIPSYYNDEVLILKKVKENENCFNESMIVNN